MDNRQVGVIGASSLVGDRVLAALVGQGKHVTAFSRSHRTAGGESSGVTWKQLPHADDDVIPTWIIVAPIWVLPDYFDFLLSCKAKRVVALSSTSRFTKLDSAVAQERDVALKLVEAESRLIDWAEQHGIDWVILRPTLIYGGGRDRNVAAIARVVRRLGFFPIVGEGRGLRQPIHADDVASACIAAARRTDLASGSYDISGGDTISYHEMVKRIQLAMERPVRILHLPLWGIRPLLWLIHCVPGYRHVNPAMASRMDVDLVFDHSQAAIDLGFSPRGFSPSPEDVSSGS